MTEMRRVTIVIPQNLDERIWELKKEDRFLRCSYAEMARRLLNLGLVTLCAGQQGEAGEQNTENAGELPGLDD